MSDLTCIYSRLKLVRLGRGVVHVVVVLVVDVVHGRDLRSESKQQTKGIMNQFARAGGKEDREQGIEKGSFRMHVRLNNTFLTKPLPPPNSASNLNETEQRRKIQRIKREKICHF